MCRLGPYARTFLGSDAALNARNDRNGSNWIIAGRSQQCFSILKLTDDVTCGIHLPVRSSDGMAPVRSPDYNIKNPSLRPTVNT